MKRAATILLLALAFPVAGLAHDELGGSNASDTGNDGCEYRTQDPLKDEQGGGDMTPVLLTPQIKVTAGSGETCNFAVGLVNYDTFGEVEAAYVEYPAEAGPFTDRIYSGNQVECAKDSQVGPTNLPHKKYASFVFVPDGFVSFFDAMAGRWYRGHIECGE